MNDLTLFLAIMGRLWYLWVILIGGMIAMMVGEYLEYKKEDENK